MLDLTVVINTKNEEQKLPALLKSLKPLSAHVMVVDMNSHDRTTKIAKDFGAEVINYKEEHGFADPARNFAFSKVKTNWILVMDADEVLTPELALFIKARVESPTADVYYLARKNLFFGQWVKHTGWWPDYNPRLFRTGYLSWPARVHGSPEVKGRVENVSAKENLAILHYNYDSVDHYLEKLNRYTTLAATSLKINDIKAPISQAQVLDKFLSEFLRRYFSMEGWKDGVMGSGLSLLQASYELSTLLKIWELNGCPSSNADAESGIRRLIAFKKEINYWVADYQVKKSYGLAKVFWLVRRKFQI